MSFRVLLGSSKFTEPPYFSNIQVRDGTAGSLLPEQSVLWFPYLEIDINVQSATARMLRSLCD